MRWPVRLCSAAGPPPSVIDVEHVRQKLHAVKARKAAAGPGDSSGADSGNSSSSSVGSKQAMSQGQATAAAALKARGQRSAGAGGRLQQVHASVALQRSVIHFLPGCLLVPVLLSVGLPSIPNISTSLSLVLIHTQFRPPCHPVQNQTETGAVPERDAAIATKSAAARRAGEGGGGGGGAL